jgi:hypothetical protein
VPSSAVTDTSALNHTHAHRVRLLIYRLIPTTHRRRHPDLSTSVSIGGPVALLLSLLPLSSYSFLSPICFALLSSPSFPPQSIYHFSLPPSFARARQTSITAVPTFLPLLPPSFSLPYSLFLPLTNHIHHLMFLPFSILLSLLPSPLSLSAQCAGASCTRNSKTYLDGGIRLHALMRHSSSRPAHFIQGIYTPFAIHGTSAQHTMLCGASGRAYRHERVDLRLIP